MLAVLFVGGTFVIDHEDASLTAGGLSSFILYTTQLSWTSSSISESISSIITATGAIERVFSMIDYNPKIK